MSQTSKVASDQMLTAIGACTLHWSLTEAAIDSMVAMVYHRFGGNAFERELPRMLGRKLKFLRKGFKRSPLLSHLHDEAAMVLGHIETLSETRNLMIHGTPMECGSEAIEFRWIKVEPQIHRWEHHTVSHAQLLALAADTLLVGGAASRLAGRIADWLLREHNGEPNSERPE